MKIGIAFLLAGWLCTTVALAENKIAPDDGYDTRTDERSKAESKKQGIGDDPEVFNLETELDLDLGADTEEEAEDLSLVFEPFDRDAFLEYSAAIREASAFRQYPTVRLEVRNISEFTMLVRTVTVKYDCEVTDDYKKDGYRHYVVKRLEPGATGRVTGFDSPCDGPTPITGMAVVDVNFRQDGLPQFGNEVRCLNGDRHHVMFELFRLDVVRAHRRDGTVVTARLDDSVEMRIEELLCGFVSPVPSRGVIRALKGLLRQYDQELEAECLNEEGGAESEAAKLKCGYLVGRGVIGVKG